MHEFMSDNELRYFYLLDWADNVIDIREQYPLLDIDRATSIAEELDIDYPTDKKSGTPFILTTDFFITVNMDGKEKHIARTIKPSEELNKSRVIEKYEIERKYWRSFDIDWGIVTEKDIPVEFSKNIEWVHSCLTLEDNLDLQKKDAFNLAEILKVKLHEVDIPIRELTTLMDKELKLTMGTSLFLFKYLIAKKDIKLDLNKRIDLNQSPSEVLKTLFDNDNIDRRIITG